MREQFRIVEARLDRLGFPWRRRPGGKHQAYEVEAWGDVVTVPVAFSPRDRHCAGLSTAKQIERALDRLRAARKRGQDSKNGAGG